MKTNEDYQRVAPRDFFNESKLLKCLGRLTLLIHDGMTPVKIGMIEDFRYSSEFKIGLMDDGHLVVTNRQFKIKEHFVIMKTVYNCKKPYPLICEHEYVEYPVFDDNGEWTEEFIEFCKGL